MVLRSKGSNLRAPTDICLETWQEEARPASYFAPWCRFSWSWVRMLGRKLGVFKHFDRRKLRCTPWVSWEGALPERCAWKGSPSQNEEGLALSSSLEQIKKHRPHPQTLIWKQLSPNGISMPSGLPAAEGDALPRMGECA